MPKFICQTAQEGSVFVIRGIGYLDESGGTMVRKYADEAFSKGFQKIILNFSQAPVINSTGVAQIIELVEVLVDERKGSVIFVGLSELTSGVFKMVGLLKMGKVLETEAEAFKAF